MKKFTLIFCFIISHLAYAIPQYQIVIDADKTIYDIHLFQISPTFQELFTYKASLKSILDVTQTKLTELKINPQNVKLNLFGTERIRILPAEEQNEFYKTTKNFIEKNYLFPIESMQTLSEKEQLVYTWVTLNYLAHDFIHTKGLINLDHDQAEIIYEIPESKDLNNEAFIKINNKTYFLSIQRFPGKMMLQHIINQNSLAFTCYPTHAMFAPNQIGHFNLSYCSHLYADLLKESTLPNMMFVTSGYAYRIYDFFAAAIPEKEAFEARLNYVCSTPWEMMKADYDNFSESDLMNFCIHAIFIDNLFYKTLHLSAEQLWVTNQIEHTPIDWTIGFLLHQAGT